MIVTIALILLLDQFSKFYISKSLYLGQSIPIIKGVFHVTIVYNTGAAFGIFPNATFFFIAISIVAIALITYYTKINLPSPKGPPSPSQATVDPPKLEERRPDFGELSAEALAKADKIPLALILSGAIGNLIDRLRFGYVVDFLDFRIWPVFNVADSAITIGAILLAYSILKKSNIKNQNHKMVKG